MLTLYTWVLLTSFGFPFSKSPLLHISAFPFPESPSSIKFSNTSLESTWCGNDHRKPMAGTNRRTKTCSGRWGWRTRWKGLVRMAFSLPSKWTHIRLQFFAPNFRLLIPWPSLLLGPLVSFGSVPMCRSLLGSKSIVTRASLPYCFQSFNNWSLSKVGTSPSSGWTFSMRTPRIPVGETSMNIGLQIRSYTTLPPGKARATLSPKFTWRLLIQNKFCSKQTSIKRNFSPSGSPFYSWTLS